MTVFTLRNSLVRQLIFLSCKMTRIYWCFLLWFLFRLYRFIGRNRILVRVRPLRIDLESFEANFHVKSSSVIYLNHFDKLFVCIIFTIYKLFNCFFFCFVKNFSLSIFFICRIMKTARVRVRLIYMNLAKFI